MASVWLALLALLLAGPVPAVLARARWPGAVPRAAVVLWQSVALAAVLAALGAVLAAPEELLRASSAGTHPRGLGLVVAIAVAGGLAGLIVARLSGVLVLLAVRTRRRREHHREMADLLGRALEDGAGTSGSSPGTPRSHAVLRVLDGAVPFAYCVPGRDPRVIITGATLERLAPGELRAVLTHEQAHLDARHDVVREGFTALHRAFPRIVRSREARDAVALLLEMLADDAACRRRYGGGLAAMAGALDAFADGDPDGPAGLDLTRRRHRLHATGARPRPVLAAGTYLVAAALVVVPTVVVVIPWMTGAVTAALAR